MLVRMGIVTLMCIGLAGPLLAADAHRAPVVVVAQDGKGEFNGTDETPILAAIAKIRATGGTIQVGPGLG